MTGTTGSDPCRPRRARRGSSSCSRPRMRRWSARRRQPARTRLDVARQISVPRHEDDVQDDACTASERIDQNLKCPGTTRSKPPLWSRRRVRRTLVQVGQVLGVSKERVRQIQDRALAEAQDLIGQRRLSKRKCLVSREKLNDAASFRKRRGPVTGQATSIRHQRPQQLFRNIDHELRPSLASPGNRASCSRQSRQAAISLRRRRRVPFLC